MAQKVEEQYFRLSVNSVAFQGDHPLAAFQSYPWVLPNYNVYFFSQAAQAIVALIQLLILTYSPCRPDVRVKFTASSFN